jgi:hypothetical protein
LIINSKVVPEATELAGIYACIKSMYSGSGDVVFGNGPDIVIVLGTFLLISDCTNAVVAIVVLLVPAGCVVLKEALVALVAVPVRSPTTFPVTFPTTFPV